MKMLQSILYRLGSWLTEKGEVITAKAESLGPRQELNASPDEIQSALALDSQRIAADIAPSVLKASPWVDLLSPANFPQLMGSAKAEHHKPEPKKPEEGNEGKVGLNIHGHLGVGVGLGVGIDLQTGNLDVQA